MPVKRINKNETEAILEKQIGSLGGEPNDDEIGQRIEGLHPGDAVQPQPGQVGGKLTHTPGDKNPNIKDEVRQFAEEKGLTQLGERIGEKAEIRDGWIDVDRNLLGDRNYYYPEDWIFRIKPATVEAVRNWSTIDENNPTSVNTVFDEMLKSCLAIRTNRGPMPWSQINVWDRLFFVLLIREYTFAKGEAKIEFTRECPNCESEITFHLDSQSLMYDTPDEDLLKMYDQETRTWHIYPSDYDVQWKDDEVTLYVPTREKDNAITDYVYARLQEDRNAKIDRVFMKFLPWMLPKISKDTTIARGQIRKAQAEFNSWDTDMFTFMDEVINNISVTPATTLLGVCEACGEEATAPIQFPDGISSLFAMAGRHKKFGKK